MGAENLAPTGFRSLDRPARSESLYQLRHPGPLKKNRVRGIYVIMFLKRAPYFPFREWKRSETKVAEEY